MSELTVDGVQKLKVTELKTELAARDLPTKGKKQELADRLVEHLQGGDSQAAGSQEQDPAGQTSGEAPQLADAAQANTESLPSELPAVPPANEDSAQDLEGAEPKLSEDKAADGVETAPGQSEVVRPDVNSLDQTPGVVSSTGATETETNGADVGEKRKRDDESAAEPAVLPLNGAPEPVAAQAETAEGGNDSVPAPPADVEQPDVKRLKTDDADAAASADIPVPSATSDIPVPGQSSDASASLLTPQADPILPLNEAIVPDATSSSLSAAAPGSEDPKSQQPPIA